MRNTDTLHPKASASARQLICGSSGNRSRSSPDYDGESLRGNNVERTRVGVRWTIGDVSDEGFEALRLSVWGAFRLFGEDAVYAVASTRFQ